MARPETLLRAILRDCELNLSQWREYVRWLASENGRPRGPEVVASTGDALLAAVIDSPDDDLDDLPRLAYADWLEDNGDPERAEFIQAQVGFHRGKRDDPRTLELDARQRALLKSNRRRWCRAVCPGILEGRFSRGFLEGVRMKARAFLFHARRLFSVAPIEWLSLEDVLPLHAELLSFYPWLARLKILDLSGNGLDADSLEWLTLSPFLGGVECLDLSGSYLPDESPGVRELCDAVDLRSLTDLDLGESHVGPRGVRDLAEDDLLWQLGSLRLAGNPIGDRGAESLARSRWASTLGFLDLTGCAIGDRGAAALARSRRLEGLIHLWFRNNPISTAVAQRLRDRFGQRVRF